MMSRALATFAHNWNPELLSSYPPHAMLVYITTPILHHQRNMFSWICRTTYLTQLGLGIPNSTLVAKLKFSPTRAHTLDIRASLEVGVLVHRLQYSYVANSTANRTRRERLKEKTRSRPVGISGRLTMARHQDLHTPVRAHVRAR
jgi:hypothetical protein